MSVSKGQFLFQAQGGLVPATQAQMEGATMTTQVAVTPGSQKWHPGTAKAWVTLATNGGSPTLLASYNVSSVTDSGTGFFAINFGASFADGVYSWVGSGIHQAGIQDCQPLYGITSSVTKTGGVFPMNTLNFGDTPVDPIQAAMAFYGDQ